LWRFSLRFSTNRNRECLIHEKGFSPLVPGNSIRLLTWIDLLTNGTRKVSFIGLEELVKNKETAGRRQDLIDLEFLRKKLASRKS
jgi:hypothetical protein